MLEVAIHGDYVFSAGMVETGCEAGGLTKVTSQADYRDAAVYGGDFAEQVERAIGRAVVYQYQLEGFPVGLHYCFEAVVEVGYVLLFVMQGDDDRVSWHDGSIIRI